MACKRFSLLAAGVESLNMPSPTSWNTTMSASSTRSTISSKSFSERSRSPRLRTLKLARVSSPGPEGLMGDGQGGTARRDMACRYRGEFRRGVGSTYGTHPKQRLNDHQDSERSELR